jgi:hypothetical protein
LTDDVLDRVDEIVPPGTTIKPADSSFDPPADSREGGEALTRRVSLT